MQLSLKVLHVVDPQLHAHLLSCVLFEFRDSTGDCHMTLTFDRYTFQLSKSEEQFGNLSDVALPTLFSNPFGPFWLIFCPN